MCYDELKEKGYNLKGLSPDALLMLEEGIDEPVDCEDLLEVANLKYG